jgi:hypothetical protein
MNLHQIISIDNPNPDSIYFNDLKIISFSCKTNNIINVFDTLQVLCDDVVIFDLKTSKLNTNNERLSLFVPYIISNYDPLIPYKYSVICTFLTDDLVNLDFDFYSLALNTISIDNIVLNVI